MEQGCHVTIIETCNADQFHRHYREQWQYSTGTIDSPYFLSIDSKRIDTPNQNSILDNAEYTGKVLLCSALPVPAAAVIALQRYESVRDGLPLRFGFCVFCIC